MTLNYQIENLWRHLTVNYWYTGYLSRTEVSFGIQNTDLLYLESNTNSRRWKQASKSVHHKVKRKKDRKSWKKSVNWKRTKPKGLQTSEKLPEASYLEFKNFADDVPAIFFFHFSDTKMECCAGLLISKNKRTDVWLARWLKMASCGCFVFLHPAVSIGKKRRVSKLNQTILSSNQPKETVNSRSRNGDAKRGHTH